MSREIEVIISWKVNSEGVICNARGCDKRTHLILSDVAVNIPVYTMDDFMAIHGESGKKEIENSATNFAMSVAEKAPQ